MKGTAFRAGFLVVLVMLVIWHAPRSREARATDTAPQAQSGELARVGH